MSKCLLSAIHRLWGSKRWDSPAQPWEIMMLWKSMQGLSAAGAECPSAESRGEPGREAQVGPWSPSCGACQEDGLHPVTKGVDQLGWYWGSLWSPPPHPSPLLSLPFFCSLLVYNFLTASWYPLSSLCITATAATNNCHFSFFFLINNCHFSNTHYVQNLC